MNRKNLPLLLMLTAGAVTCIVTFIRKYSILERMASLLAVLVLFYLLGSILKWTLDHFDMQNERKRQEEGEVIKKENTEGGENGEQQEVQSTPGNKEA